VSLAKRFYELFKGNDRVHGTFNVKETKDPDGKKKKGAAKVLQEQTTVEHWQEHLDGEVGLGIVPIMDDNHCWWGAVDIDDYSLDHRAMLRKIESFKLPGVLGRSKSGGGHLYFFFMEPVPAADLLPKLKEIAALLGYAKSEVFPKQRELLVERGDSGNFLNMPYFAGINTTRAVYDNAGELLSPEEFLDYAWMNRVAADYFFNIKTRKDHKTGPLPDGPPCLQHLCEQGFGEGSRNNAMFNLGVYARMAYSDKWESYIHKYNLEHMNPPLSNDEVSLIIKQLQKKEYFYKCDDQPINAFCNKDICLTRKFGVGPGQLNTELSSLIKINGDPPIWILNVDGDRVELSTEALIMQSKFQKECVAQINKYPISVNQRAWQNRMQLLLDNLTVVEVAPDATLKGEFEDLLTSFCTDRAKGSIREDILQGIAVWIDGRVYFQIKDLKKHLQTNDFTSYSSNKITLRLQDMQAEKMFWRVREKGVHVWSFPQSRFKAADEAEPELALPPLELDKDHF
jgi:hypothetical protein